MHRRLRILAIAALCPLLVRGAVQADHTPTSRLSLQTFGYRVVRDTQFAAGDPHTWYEERLDHSSAQLAGGRFVVRVKDGYSRDSDALGLPDHSDGAIGAVVRVAGSGRVGVMGRWSTDADGNWSQYDCWFDTQGSAGLSRESHDNTNDIASVTDRVPAGQDHGVELRVTGSRVDCFVDGIRVVSYHDGHPLPQGSWGVYITSSGDPVQGAYARLLLAK